MLTELSRIEVKVDALLGYMHRALSALDGGEPENAAQELKEASWEVMSLSEDAIAFFQRQNAEKEKSEGNDASSGEGGPAALGGADSSDAQHLVTQPTPASA